MQNPKPNLYHPGKSISLINVIHTKFCIGNGPKKSLNREQRRRDLIKITVEN